MYSISFVSMYIIANIVMMWTIGRQMPNGMHILVGTFFGVENGCLCVIKCTEISKASKRKNPMIEAMKESQYLDDEDDGNMVG